MSKIEVSSWACSNTYLKWFNEVQTPFDCGHGKWENGESGSCTGNVPVLRGKVILWPKHMVCGRMVMWRTESGRKLMSGTLLIEFNQIDSHDSNGGVRRVLWVSSLRCEVCVCGASRTRMQQVSKISVKCNQTRWLILATI